MVDLMIDIMIDYKYEYDGSFHIGFINWEEESCKMATGSMCMMQCNVKRWGCDDYIDDEDDDDGEMKFDYFAFKNIFSILRTITQQFFCLIEVKYCSTLRASEG